MPPTPLGRLWPCALWALLILLPLACARATAPVPGAPSVEQATAEPGGAAACHESMPQTRKLHFARLGVDTWHQQGWVGQGIKVALFDSGFRGYRDFLGKALPTHVEARSFRKDQNLEARDSQHGILCGEVIHALAPAAELLLANWEPDDHESFLAAVRWARDRGARILSCSVIMPSWSDGEGGGAVHANLAELLGSGSGPDDLLCFASAGNTAQRHWTGRFQPTPKGWHQWAPGQVRNVLTPWGRERVAVELYGAVDAAYELHVFQQGTGALVASERVHVDPTQACGRAVVRFEPTTGAAYHVYLRGPRDSQAPFHVVALGGNLETHASHGSIPFPADGARVVAVGAVDGLGQRTSYSSCGPNSRFPKPDFAAPVPFPSRCRERPFAGTSAAAPQAAALAAVVWSRHPAWTADQVGGFFRGAAEDLGPAGHDFETGHGLIRLP